MNSQVNVHIRQRLSLRKPLAEALELTSRLTDPCWCFFIKSINVTPCPL